MVKQFKRKSFAYHNGELALLREGETLDLKSLIQDSGRAYYIYNSQTIKDRIKAYQEAFKGFKNHIHFAVKANPNLEILKLMKSHGLGADVVSIGEFNRALEAGFDASEIIFSGVAKSRKEIKEALQKKVFQINCESLAEIKRLAEVAKELGLKASMGVRINPDIPVDTHPYIATGFRENKFGIPLTQVPEVLAIVAANREDLSFQGISCHIGSQIMQTDSLIKALDSVLNLYAELQKQGVEISYLDLGGGLGVDYSSNNEEKDLAQIKDFGEKITEKLAAAHFKGELLFEPGRSLVARAGVLLTKVEYVKNNGFKNFIVVNSGMHHLLRPSLYKAYHQILPLKEETGGKLKSFDVVGPICESSDVLGYERLLVEPEEGDWLAVLDAGAYGMSMASGYNMHPFPIEVLV